MPNDVKAVLSAIVLVVALALAYWRHSPIRPDCANAVLFTAAFMIIAMWIFPEAGVKKGELKKSDPA
jgi:hypothetical protein